MKRARNSVLSIVVLFFLSASAHALARNNQPASHPAAPLTFDHLNADDGLSGRFVGAILQDAQGFMWFGTADALNRYDGRQFTIYKHDPEDASSLSNSGAMALYEDRRGDMWTVHSRGSVGTPVDRCGRRRVESFQSGKWGEWRVYAVYSDSGQSRRGKRLVLCILPGGSGRRALVRHDVQRDR